MPPAVPKLLAPLPTGKDYIIYTVWNSAEKQNEIWAHNPDDGEAFVMFRSGEIWPGNRSSSGSLWLFGDSSAIYVANADGTGIRLVYQNPKYIRMQADWISETDIMVEAFQDLSEYPDIYRINTETGKAEGIDIKGIKYIQAVCIEKNVWIGWDSALDIVRVVDQGLDTYPILENYHDVSVDIFDHDEIQFLPGSDEFIFIASDIGLDNYSLRKSSLSGSEVSTLLEPAENEYNLEFQISPDGYFVGVVYETLEGNYFYVIDLSTGNLIYHWVFPYTIGSTHFIWSPDATQIALPYFEGVTGSGSEIVFGIQIMDLATGETRVVLKRDVLWFNEWVSLK